MRLFLLLLAFSFQAYAGNSGEPVGSAPLLPPLQMQNTDAQIIAASSPDNSFKTVSDLLRIAQSSIRLASYTLESDEIADYLVSACTRGVQVRILLDGWPAVRPTNQKVSEQTLYIAKRIKDAGCSVLFIASKDSKRLDRRYRWYHAKYIVIDDIITYVSSENFSSKTGHPIVPRSGNRGWTLAIKNADFAKAYAQIFDQDTNRNYRDIIAYGESPEYTLSDKSFRPDREANWGHYVAVAPLRYTGTVSLERVLSPDDSLATNRSILKAMQQAQTSIDVQQLSFSPHWGSSKDNPGSAPSPFTESLIAAARNGVRVRVMLMPPYFPGPRFQANIFDSPSSSSGSDVNEDSKSNSAMIEYIRDIARQENLDMQVSFFAVSANDISTLHNKGMIVDATKTLISSINWVENAAKYNREAAVIITSPQVSNYYQNLFNSDWQNYRKN